MNLADRDAYVIAQLARFMAAGMTQRQAVSEVIRTSGFASLALAGHDAAALESDVSGMQTAVSAVAVTATRTATAAHPAVGKVPSHPKPAGVEQSTAWQIRALAAGA